MDIRDLLHGGADLVGSLTPSLLGSAVAHAWKPALPFRQRLLQWVVGSTVSYYATVGIVAITDWNRFAAQSIAFGIGLIAFDATPRMMKALGDTLAAIPARVSDRIFGKGN